jgi:hypothetical protein
VTRFDDFQARLGISRNILTACGHVVSAVPACSHCGEPLDARIVTAVPGPGAVTADRDRVAAR